MKWLSFVLQNLQKTGMLYKSKLAREFKIHYTCGQINIRQEMNLMSEPGKRSREEEYADSGRENWSAYEETYRDGSLKNECWNSHADTGRKKDPDGDE